MEPSVGAERVALAGEHAGRVLALSLEGEHAGGEGEVAGQVLGPEPPHQLAVLGDPGQGHLGDAVPRERRPPQDRSVVVPR